MKKHVKIFITGILFLAIMGLGSIPFMGPDPANACGGGKGPKYTPQKRGSMELQNAPRVGGACGYGAGSPGGGDYAPQKRTSAGRPSMTKEQAYDIVSSHVKKLNPALEIGDIKDAGKFFEAEILTEGKDVVDRLAVDKRSGRLRTIY